MPPYSIGHLQRELRSWNIKTNSSANDTETVTAAIKSLSKHKVSSFIEIIAAGLSTFDWRTSSTPDLSELDRQRQSVFRGSGGYKELRALLLKHLAELDNDVGATAKRLRETV